MPELPEVETVVRELRPYLIGKTIRALQVYWDKTYQNHTNETLSGQQILELNRKGKYIIFRLNRTFLIIHLRMTGRLHRDEAPNQNHHLRVKIIFDDNESLLFFDQRKFGRIYHVADAEEIIGKIGSDALDSNFTADNFIDSLEQSGQSIKSFLLSQNNIAGVGNIYADESLFKAKIHPASTCKQLPVNHRRELFDQLRDTLNSAIDNMGTTISDYRDANGAAGKNQAFLLVYNRQGQPCTRCGESIVKQKIASRGTHFCPDCQVLYAEGK